MATSWHMHADNFYQVPVKWKYVIEVLFPEIALTQLGTRAAGCEDQLFPSP